MPRYDSRRLSSSQGDPVVYGAYIWDAAADIFRMDATLCRYLGLPDVLGIEGTSLRHVIDLMNGADRAEFSDAIESSARTGSPFRQSFRLRASGERSEKLQAIGHSFFGAGRAPGVCTGLVFRMTMGMKSVEAELTDRCIAAYESAKNSNSAMVQYLISMALIELGYQIAGFEPGKAQ